MNPEIAEILAYSSLFSAIFPLLLYSLFQKNLRSKFKYFGLAILISLFFDVFALLNNQFSLNLFEITRWFDVFAIVIWGLFYLHLLKSFPSYRKKYRWFFSTMLIFTLVSTQIAYDHQITNYIGANIYNLFQLISALGIIALMVVFTKHWSESDLQKLYLLLIVLVYFALIVGVFAFFSDLNPSAMMKVYAVKWISYIVYNIAFAVLLFYVSKTHRATKSQENVAV